MGRPPYGRRPVAAAIALAATLHGVAAFGANDPIILLDFWSPTCGPCMQMKPTVEALTNARYPIRQVDVSRQPELARQYGVTGIPCFVMLVDGHEVDRVVGATSSERLQQMFSRAKEVVETQRRLRGQSPSDPPAPRVSEDQNAWAGGEHARRVPSNPASSVNEGGASTTDEIKPIEDGALPGQVNSRLLSSSVRLTVEVAQTRSHGTATVIDARAGEALLITCGHLFRDSKGQGPVSVELFEVGPQGVRVVETVEGRVVSYDLERDVAFVSIRPTRPVCVAQVAPQRTPIAKGDLAASVGCSNGEDPTVVATRITCIDRYLGPPNIETSGAPPIGRSGGGLFNEQGQLVGVCNAADKEGNRGLYASLDSIHDELDRLGLRDVYDKPAANIAADIGVTNSGVRGQEPSEAAPDPTNVAENLPVDGLQPSSPNRDAKSPQQKAIEQAALEEIVSRAATKKVICIIQSDEPGVENEIITIENVSNEFVEALAARRRKEPAVGASGPVVQATRDDARYNR